LNVKRVSKEAACNVLVSLLRNFFEIQTDLDKRVMSAVNVKEPDLKL